MKIHFNKFEKVAGLFVGIAVLSCILGMIGIAVKNGWFASKVNFVTELESADGVHAGTIVQIAGLRVGAVNEVELMADDKVLVRFEVLERFRDKVRKDSRVQMFRPFILAEKVLEISVGSTDAELVENDGLIATQASTDIMDLLSGKKMGAVLASFDHLADSLKVIGEAFANKDRTRALVQMVDRLVPLVDNLNALSTDLIKITTAANKNKRIETIVSSLTTVSEQLQKMAPAFNEEAPNVGMQLGQIVSNLNVLTTEFKKVTPAISMLAPELPRTSRRAVEALDETVVLLKALQKSFLLRGNVREVREEEVRKPANTTEP
ncbi:MAG: MCE family protein [Bdellovibrionales bacterium]|nr:MCE family protein [Bdellovibrionales bacterium]